MQESTKFCPDHLFDLEILDAIQETPPVCVKAHGGALFHANVIGFQFLEQLKMRRLFLHEKLNETTLAILPASLESSFQFMDLSIKQSGEAKTDSDIDYKSKDESRLSMIK